MFYFHYRHSAGECREGPYSLDEVLAQRFRYDWGFGNWWIEEAR